MVMRYFTARGVHNVSKILLTYFKPLIVCKKLVVPYGMIQWRRISRQPVLQVFFLTVFPKIILYIDLLL